MPDADAAIGFYFERLLEAVKTQGHLPLFDEQSNRLVQAAIGEGRTSVTSAQEHEGREARLALQLFERLPHVEHAKLDELVDIRRELDAPLHRFRGAVLQYAEDLEAAGWDDDFNEEAHLLYRQKIKPALSELEERIAENSPIRNFFDNLSTKDSVVSAAAGGVLHATIGLGVTSDVAPILADLSPTALAAAGIPAAAISGLKAYKQWRDRNAEHRKHQLFYYCEIPRRLKH